MPQVLSLRFRFAALLGVLSFLTPAVWGALVGSAQASAELCRSAARLVATETGVPEAMLQAIALAETGQRRDGVLQPWPWAVNDGGTGRWFDSRAAAEAYAATAIAEGRRNIDIGCFQLNHRWHGAAFPSLSEMFDPVANARYAARYLDRLQAETGDWTLAAGAYHSRTPVHNERYRARLTQLMASVPTAGPPRRVAPQAAENGFPLLARGGSGSGGSLVPIDGQARPLLTALAAPLFGG